MKRDLENYTKEELIDEINYLRDKHSYGLSWELQNENAVERLKTHIPFLKEIHNKSISNDSNGFNLLIEGENFQSLVALSSIYRGKIDLIYIDPPYNTGKEEEFRFNDNWVSKEDTFKHSKWISFMNARLKLAKELLSDKGIILISNDDNENANLKLLCDSIFQEKNFIGNIVWRGGRRNRAESISTSHEYILFYTKNFEAIKELDISWREEKTGLDQIYKKHKQLKKVHKDDFQAMAKDLKEWFKNLDDSNPAKKHKHYNEVDGEGIFFPSDISAGGGKGGRWKIENPHTGENVSIPSRGWAYPDKNSMLEDIKKGNIHFKGNNVPNKKRYLKNHETQLIESVFYKDRRAGSKRFRDIMGDGVFENPKDEDVIAKWIKNLTDDQSIILDFFAGSGTTAHSVLKLNQVSGNRKFILITNNENEICRDVTYPRIKKVIEGYRGKISKKDFTGLGGNLKYYKLNEMIFTGTDKDKIQFFQNAQDHIKLKEDSFKIIKSTEEFLWLSNGNNDLAIIGNIFNIEGFRDFAKKSKNKVNVYVFSVGDDDLEDVFRDIESVNEVYIFPEPELKIYEEIRKEFINVRT